MGKKSKKKYKKYSSSSSSSDSESSSSSSSLSNSSSNSSSSDEKSKRKHKYKKKHSKSKKHLSKRHIQVPLNKSIGPVLPERNTIDTFGPSLPPISNVIGPALPPHLLKNKEDLSTNDSTILAKNSSFGPALPPSLGSSISSSRIGPSLLGPSLPPHLIKTDEHYDDDDDVVGPMPEGASGGSNTQKALEMRAMLLKHEMLNKKNITPDDGSIEREEWMLELPPEKSAIIGLGPRQFRAKEAPDMSRRSEWTDTPEDKLRKQKQLLIDGGEALPDPEEERRLFLIQERDKSMQQMIEKCKKSKKHKREKSLMEIHAKKLKKEKKKKDKERGDKPVERRPFDRNVDLQANRFDEAQKKKLINKAQLLDTRFSTGESKFL